MSDLKKEETTDYADYTDSEVLNLCNLCNLWFSLLTWRLVAQDSPDATGVFEGRVLGDDLDVAAL